MSGAPVVEVSEKLNFAYKELFDVDPRIVQKVGHIVKELDLSNNNLRDLTFLKGFTRLETLVLDNNEVTSHTKFPKMELLHTLWVNSNNIDNLIIFIDNLATNAPNIKFLSMLKNEACPNYFNGKSLKEYSDYRLYVISRLPTLTHLDSSPVTEEERNESTRLYAALPLPSKPTVPTEDIRAPPIKKPDPLPEKKKRRGKRLTEDLPEFLNGGKTMGPPPPDGAPSTAEGDDDFEDESSDFTSDGGVDSDEWTDEEVEEDSEVIADTHVWKGPGPEPKPNKSKSKSKRK